MPANEPMTDYQKERLSKLENFERAVKSVVEATDTVIGWLWLVLPAGLGTLLYFKPLEQNATVQCIAFGIFSCVMWGMSFVWRKLGKALD